MHENVSSPSSLVNSSRRHSLALGRDDAMATRKPTDSNDAPLDHGPIFEDFSAVKALNENYALNGWEADYRQIEAGRLRAQVAARDVGRIGLFRETVSHQMEASARTPDNVFSIILSMGEGEVRISGRRIARDGLLVLPPSTDVHLSTAGGTDALTINVPVDMLSDCHGADCNDDALLETNDITWLCVEERHIDRFRNLAHARLTQSANRQPNDGVDSVVVRNLSRLLVRPVSDKNVGDRYGRLEKYRIILRAKDYIHENLRELIRVIDLCKHCGVSLSTLERIFRRELGTGPIGYVRAARLHEVRRMLQAANAGGLMIAEIAMNFGFTHMGRFSHQYRAQFGRSPSEERSLVKGRA